MAGVEAPWEAAMGAHRRWEGGGGGEEEGRQRGRLGGGLQGGRHGGGRSEQLAAPCVLSVRGLLLSVKKEGEKREEKKKKEKKRGKKEKISKNFQT
jgi:hypothetical protein